MPYPQAARGLGDAQAAGVDVNDVAATAAVLGVALPSGFATWGDFARYAYGAVTSQQDYLARLQHYPAAMAYAYARAALAAQPHPAVATEVSHLLSDPLSASVPAFVAAVQAIFPSLWTLAERYAPGEVWDTSDPAVAAIVGRSSGDTAARAAWQTALTQSAYTTPSGFRVPTDYILDGPTALPDGTVYLQYHDPVAAADGSPADLVLWWNGPQYQPPHTSPGNPYVKTLDNQILQLRDRGTGDWYRCMAVYNDDQSCRPPLNWTGGYDLPPAILASLGTQGGAVAHAGTIPPPPAMAVDADGNPVNGPQQPTQLPPGQIVLTPTGGYVVPPQESTQLPPGQIVLTPTGGYVVPPQESTQLPPGQIVLTPTGGYVVPPTVTQDENGNLIPSRVEVSTLPSAAVSAPATSSAGIPPLAIAAAAGLALWLFTRGRR